MPGMGHGVRQALLCGEWRCRIMTEPNFDLLDDAMAAWVPESLPLDIAGTRGAAALLRRMLFWAAAVQRQHKLPVFDAATIWGDAADAVEGHWQFAMPCVAAQASHFALQWVSTQIHQIWQPRATPMHQAPADTGGLDVLARQLQAFQVAGFNTIRFLAAAHVMDVPTHCVAPGVYAFGQGRHARWLESTYSDQTPVIGARIARDKSKTALVLQQLGLPAPRHAHAPSPERAVQIARVLGYPVVVKPVDRDQGMGVSADLRDDEAVRVAFARAKVVSDNILVEKHFHGLDYRLTILNGHMIKAVVRRPAGVAGDGLHTIAQLVQRMREDPAYIRLSAERGHDPIVFDAEAQELLAQEGMGADTVAADGQFVVLRRRANVSAGGTPALVTHCVHPDNQRLAERCARALGLDLAGVDLIMADIALSWLQTGALVCEVNSQPQLGSSLTPAIYAEVLRQLLPWPHRIPVALIVGAGQAFARALVAHQSQPNAPWAMADHSGVWLGDEHISAVRDPVFSGARMLEANREAAAAVVVMTPVQILRSGLPFAHIDVLVLAEPDAGGRWNAVQMQAMWKLVLPHVAHVVAVDRQLQAWLPAQWADTAAALPGTDGEDPLQIVASLIKSGNNTARP